MAKKSVNKKTAKTGKKPVAKSVKSTSSVRNSAKKATTKKTKSKKVSKANKSSELRSASDNAVKSDQPSSPVAVESDLDVGDATSQVEVGPPSESQLKKVKTGLSRKDLMQYKQLLLGKRDELLGDVASLETEIQNSGGNLSNVPLHMADVGSDNYEQEFTLGLVASERQMLREIDEALIRITGHYYGVCLETAQPISRSRLDAKPWAKYCIEVAREKERLGQM